MGLAEALSSPAPFDPGPPAGMKQIAGRVEQRFRALLDAERLHWLSVDPDLGDPLEVLESAVLAGGKRLRPTFCFWGYAAAGHDPDADPGRRLVDDAGLALELLHAFALLHDDVMDGSDTRRGQTTPHVAWTAAHDRAGWRGESRRFGEGIAVLVGDLAHVYADSLMQDLPPAAAAVWRDMRVELMFGQYLDVVGTARGTVAADQARRIARMKSGRYTVERPLQLGAALADPLPDPATFDALARFGEPIGIAFQWRDDVLGAFGDAGALGKPVGDDLREGKPTAMLAMALEMATAPQRRVLERVGRTDLTDADIADIQQALVDTGALAAMEREIAEQRSLALAATYDPALPAATTDALVDLAWFLTDRRY